MSTRDKRPPPIMYMRNSRRRKMVLDVDLNVPPPTENRDQNQNQNQNQEGSSARAGQQGGSAPPLSPPAPQPPLTQPQAIDLEAIDDDVIISSPRAFAEARNNSRRTQERTVVVDIDSEAGSSRVIPYQRTKRRRITQNAPITANPTIINCDLFINLDGNNTYVRRNVRGRSLPPPPVQTPMPQPPPPPPPPPKELTFSCPVCMGPLVEEMSTKCGHIFCKACIKAAITAQSKCPTCRRKVTMKDTIRVYLPTAN